MRVLFITKSHDFMAPLGASILSSVALNRDHETYLCDMNIQNPLERIEELKPSIIAYSSLSGEAKYYLKLNESIKKKYPDILTIMGGPHTTFFTDVINSSTLDAICVGEGEGAFGDILDCVSTESPLVGISNIITKKEEEAHFTLRNLVEDLDSLPFPDYGLFYDNIPVMGKAPLKPITVGRGCPYKCTYCFNTRWRELYSSHGKIIRRHSVDYVIEGIKRIRRRWPLSCIKFQDDVFTYRSDDWLVEFSRKYKKEIALPFFILTRYDLLTEDMVKLLREAGCQTISMSIEAGNPDTRLNLLHRKMSDEEIVGASLLCNKYGISTFTNAMLALPESKVGDDIKSIDLAIKAKTTWTEMPIFYPYPGTELGEYAVSKGLYTPEYNQMHSSSQNSSPLSCFSKKEKNIQSNMGVLGPIAIAFPRTRNLILNYLVHLPYNKVFVFTFWAIKNYILRRKIYTTRTTLIESIRLYIRSLKQELFKHQKEE